MVTVHIPAGLRSFTGGQETVQVEGDATLRAIIERLESAYPGIRAHLVEEGDIMTGLAFFINDTQTTEGLTERVPSEASIRILPAMAGGAIAWRA
ncbi:MAG TPA: MoaD/ThiS family protein [Dehalococcoidia bacterium]|nr:MoaD/ThiS family protein [Dehalococcoidia bacterium]